MDREQYIDILELDLAELKKEKQQLIDYLGDKKKECDRYLKTFEGKEQGDYSVYYYYAKRDKKAYKEILDFIEGGKE